MQQYWFIKTKTELISLHLRHFLIFLHCFSFILLYCGIFFYFNVTSQCFFCCHMIITNNMSFLLSCPSYLYLPVLCFLLNKHVFIFSYLCFLWNQVPIYCKMVIKMKNFNLFTFIYIVLLSRKMLIGFKPLLYLKFRLSNHRDCPITEITTRFISCEHVI